MLLFTLLYQGMNKVGFRVGVGILYTCPGKQASRHARILQRIVMMRMTPGGNALLHFVPVPSSMCSSCGPARVCE